MCSVKCEKLILELTQHKLGAERLARKMEKGAMYADRDRTMPYLLTVEKYFEYSIHC